MDLEGGDNGTIKTWWSTILESSTTSATKTHNGVECTYSNNMMALPSLTITGSIKIYKDMNSNNGYQTYIKGADGLGKGITVKITLVPASTTPSAAISSKITSLF